MSFNRWRSLVDGTEFAAIPDSEADQKLAHRWVLDDVNGTVVDSGGDADGDVNGVSSVDGDWAGGSAGEGDGVDDNILLPSGVIPDLSSDFAVALSFQTDVSEEVHFASSFQDDSDLRFRLRSQDGVINMQLRVTDTADVETSNKFNDGNEYRLVINKISNDESNWEIWINQSEESVSNPNTSFGEGDGGNFTQDLPMFAESDNDEDLESHFEGIIDDFCIYDDSLTQSEIESYQNPWA